MAISYLDSEHWLGVNPVETHLALPLPPVQHDHLFIIGASHHSVTQHVCRQHSHLEIDTFPGLPEFSRSDLPELDSAVPGSGNQSLLLATETPHPAFMHVRIP